MSDTHLDLLVEPAELAQRLAEPNLLVVDLSRASTHGQLHIPGAVPMEYGDLVASRPPASGLLPAPDHLNRVLSGIGLTPEVHVVAYDDEGGGKAARLVWTLEILGHRNYSLLDGGLHAWAGDNLPLTRDASSVTPSTFEGTLDLASEVIAHAEYIHARLGDPSVALLDARSPMEYSGAQKFAARGGHIPGAVNMDWSEAMDPDRNLRLRAADASRRKLEQLGITPDRTVVAHCQTHHRSAHTWFWLKWLGYRAKGYPGSWSDWGNRSDLPVES